jgi:hypothetical protein
MTPQYFKGDADEVKMDAVGSPVMDLAGAALDQFFDEAFDSAGFLLMLYDEGRMPFSDRIPREAFIGFLVECIANANFLGTYESYIFLVNSVFGAGSSVFFEEVSPGVLTMTVSASNSVEFDFQVREFSDGAYETFLIVTANDENIEFVGFPGIESEAELSQLLSEFVPAGIFPDITLVLFSTSLFLIEDDDGEATIVDELNNDIIFFELGG